MAKREVLLARAIARGICDSNNRKPPGLLFRILRFFRVVTIVLRRYCPDLFDHLRSDVWDIDPADYQQSFSTPAHGRALCAVGDLGYSGSVCSKG